MRILIAPDGFKDSLRADQVAQAIATGLRSAYPTAKLTLLPLADGGEGTLDVLAKVYPSAEWKTITVCNPLGHPIQSQWLWLPESKTAIIELAQASGLHLLKEQDRRPLQTSTRGTGEQVLDALSLKPNKIIITLGGSATVDGGTGIARALGFRFLDSNGLELSDGGGPLSNLEHIDSSNIHPAVKHTSFSCMVDVDNPLLGENGAARVYGPQKGASEEAVKQLEQALSRLADIAEKDLNIAQVSELAGAGSAGGCPAGLTWFCNATWQAGAEMILDLVDIDQLIEEHDLVITGEGCLDSQTLNRKLVYSLAQRINKRVPLWVITGMQQSGWEPMAPLVTQFDCITDRAKNIADAIENAEQYLCQIATRPIK